MPSTVVVYPWLRIGGLLARDPGRAYFVADAFCSRVAGSAHFLPPDRVEAVLVLRAQHWWPSF
ncbi:hypothetical protein I545_2126 [Mycobacterium kansasii 662]|uniref:Uncharacterized protein n=2 Tax=Mycobacterium kansasii TaxID=1768 RepID=A0A1V3XMF8_MYCKA|nr:hypothetical protein I547_3973 [Mycobacterium kansasii 824]EUA20175.1 hypothetical protein I545_2126 [Mycobacterium kansasii 662]OOK80407.1 hypothetical protein BZL29_2139 [Mycobacterium kansasii]